MNYFKLVQIGEEYYIRYRLGIDLNDFRPTYWITNSLEDVKVEYKDKVKVNELYKQVSVNHIEIEEGLEVNIFDLTYFNFKETDVDFGYIRVENNRERFKRELIDYCNFKIGYYRTLYSESGEQTLLIIIGALSSLMEFGMEEL